MSPAITADSLKSAASETATRQHGRLIDLSHTLHAHPELGHEEVRACAWLTEALADGGFRVEAGICDLPTAFSAEIGSGRLRVYICAEYDALPGIGHACGHNMIAAAALGAGLALAPIIDDLDLTLVVIGTPAEEVLERGGKALLLERGGFDGAHAAMMVHPAPFEITTPGLIAATRFGIEFAGRASHASAAPELGINAADAAVISQVAIGLLRQQTSPEHRIHGVVDDAGDAPNIIPQRSRGRYMVRAPRIEELELLKERVLNCFRAGALATGCSLTVSGADRSYHNVVHDDRLVHLFRSNANALGRPEDVPTPESRRFQASTDMGNVSSYIPSIHPFMRVGAWPIANHQPEFTALCATTEADETLLAGAVALAWTAIDLATDNRLADALIGAAATHLPVQVRARA